jgi:hypothetical protein
VQAERITSVDDLGYVATGKDVTKVVERLEACTAESIEWPSRRFPQFDTAKTMAALFIRRRGHQKHLQPKLTTKIKVRHGFV